MVHIFRSCVIGLLLCSVYQAYAQSTNRDSLSTCLDQSLDRQSRISSCLFVAELGDTQAQFQLGKLYEGKGDIEKAIKWCRMAA